MAIDPCFTALLADRRNELRAPPPHVTLADLRNANKAFLLSAPVPPIHAVEQLEIEGASGRIALRIYRPSAAGNLPVALFCHGGGFVLGDLDTHDAICSRLALSAGGVVVSVDYGRAPESKFPGPVEDCFSALNWISTQSSRLNVDPHRLAVCGDSAGATLAAAAAMLARSRGVSVRYVAMIYPITDAACDTTSIHQYERGYLLTRSALQWFWNCYLANPQDAEDPLASILRADLTGFPPTTVATAEFDPLRSEGEAFADRLRGCGVTVVARRYLGMLHGFAGMPHLTPVATRVIEDIAGDLRAAF
jgi:acetyl esterase